MTDNENLPPKNSSDVPGETVPQDPDALLPPDSASRGDVSLDKALSDVAKKTKSPLKFKPNETTLIKYGAIGIFLVLIVMLVFSCQPAKGSMAYGICSTFLELHTPYPQTLRYTGYEPSRTAVRIYYTSIDPFGQYKLEMIECKFGPDPATGKGMILTDILRNRDHVDPDIVDKFNQTLPIIISSDPYLVLPPDWENQLLDR